MLLNPLRRYLDRLLYKFGYIRISQPMLPIGDDLVPLLRELAGPGQTDVEDVAQDLLLYAIDKRNADMASLRLW
jgi:DNA-directed RNA polymerase specialized sigma24 family protein